MFIQTNIRLLNFMVFHLYLMIVLSGLYPVSVTAATRSRRSGKGLEVCLSAASAKECNGFYGKYARNQRWLKINPDRIYVKDLNLDREVTSIILPGRYKLVFEEIEIVSPHPLEFLVGDLRIDLDGIPFLGSLQAVPSILPITGIQSLYRSFGGPSLKIGRYCDETSQRVQVDQLACRYCDLCSVGQQVEAKLGGSQSGSQPVLPHLNTETPFGKNCSSFNPGLKYRLERTITLPDPVEAERTLPTIERTLAEAFDKGEGKIVAQLYMLSRKYSHLQCSPPIWCQFLNPSDPQCTCNLKNQAFSDCLASDGYMDDYDLAACYNVEFNYLAKEVQPGTVQSACPKISPVSSHLSQSNPINQPGGAYEGIKGCPYWCCSRPREFINRYNCPTDCVFRPAERCEFPILRRN